MLVLILAEESFLGFTGSSVSAKDQETKQKV